MKTRRTITLFLIGLFGALPSCSQKIAEPPPEKPTILVSIAPYQFLVQRIAGDDFTVQAVVPSGINPHAYEPTAKQALSLSQGSVWFRIGEPFEEKIIPILKNKNPALVEFDLRDGIPLLDTSHSCSHHTADQLDRHIWLSPKLAAYQGQKIAQALSLQFPEKKEALIENANRLSEELVELDEEILSILHSVKDRVLLVSHPAFGYFCRDYDIEQLSVEFDGKDPRPRYLEELLQKATEQRAEIALTLPQHNNKGAQMIAQKLHLPIRMIDPYSTHYFETMRLLAHLIADPQYQE